MRLITKFILVLITVSCGIQSSSLTAADWNPPFKFKSDDIRIGVYPRTPSQMAAFYEGRGFPKPAIEETTRYCFITIGIRNTGNQKIWLDLTHWRFYNAQGEINRTGREQWKQIWNSMEVPLSKQATFYWTTLPELRDLHKDEPVGGNVMLDPTYTPFTIEAKFPTGENKDGKPLVIRIDKIRCLKDGEELKR